MLSMPSRRCVSSDLKVWARQWMSRRRRGLGCFCLEESHIADSWLVPAGMASSQTFKDFSESSFLLQAHLDVQ